MRNFTLFCAVTTDIRIRRMTRLTWQQEERPSIVSCPVTILGLQLTVEVHAFHCGVHSSVGGWRVEHKLTLWRESVILPPTAVIHKV